MLVDHVVRAQQSHDDGLVEGRLRDFARDRDQVEGVVVRNTGGEGRGIVSLSKLIEQPLRTMRNPHQQVGEQHVQAFSLRNARFRHLILTPSEQKYGRRQEGERHVRKVLLAVHVLAMQ